MLQKVLRPFPIHFKPDFLGPYILFKNVVLHFSATMSPYRDKNCKFKNHVKYG